MMNRRGEHHLNFVEMFVIGGGVALGIILLLSAGQFNVNESENKITVYKLDYRSINLLRTFAQSSVEVNQENQTVAYALNNYFRLKEFPKTVDYDEAVRSRLTQIKPLEELAEKVFRNQLEVGMALVAHLYNGETEISSVILAEGTGTFQARIRDDGLKGTVQGIGSYSTVPTPAIFINTREGVIEIPAYMGNDYETPEDYKIYLSIQYTKPSRESKYNLEVFV